ncbi:MAG: hypothetical protein QXQ53_09280, partial [Candidatus Methanosuratincola sp.]
GGWGARDSGDDGLPELCIGAAAGGAGGDESAGGGGDGAECIGAGVLCRWVELGDQRRAGD